jgi:hypothetical protein
VNFGLIDFFRQQRVLHTVDHIFGPTYEKFVVVLWDQNAAQQ